MKRGKINVSRAVNEVAGVVCILILIPLTISMLVVMATDAYKAKYPEPDLSLCPFCSQPVPHNR